VVQSELVWGVEGDQRVGLDDAAAFAAVGPVAGNSEASSVARGSYSCARTGEGPMMAAQYSIVASIAYATGVASAAGSRSWNFWSPCWLSLT
jgi:hypothetical protein